MQSSYPDQDHTFGQVVLTLRSALGLTQAGLATILGVSRRSVADWEASAKFPKIDNLRAFIRLAFEGGVFRAGHEAEEIRAFWKAARAKVLIDEGWLTALIATRPSEMIRPPSMHAVRVPPRAQRVDWGDSFAVASLYGREHEFDLLTSWIVEERCRVVSLIGLGGIGKSTLAISVMDRVAPQFETAIWRSVRDAPNCEALIDDLLQVLIPAALDEVMSTLDQRLNVLLAYLREHRALLVLDNLETLLDEGERMGQLRPGHESYGRLLQRIAGSEHQSCLLVTSREKLTDLVQFEGTRSPVRSLRLTRLENAACEHLLNEKGAKGTGAALTRLIEAYAGNPLALKIVAQTIVDLFDGEIMPFLAQGEIIFGGVRDLLNEQFTRLSALEQSVMLWLAILREAVSLDELAVVLVTPVPRTRLLEAVDALYRRSLIERGQKVGSFTLQSVVLEYVTAKLVTEAISEIEAGRLMRLVEHGIALAQTHEYVRQTQERLIVSPIMAHIADKHPNAAEERLMTLLEQMRTWPSVAQGYGPSNMLTLLRLMRGNLRGVDMSALVLRRAYFRGVEMENANLAGAFVQNGEFTEAFDGLIGITVSSDGQYWAATSDTGEVRVWEAGGHTLYRLWPSSLDIVYRIVFSPNGRWLVGSKWDGSIKMWNIVSGETLWTAGWPESVSIVYGMAFSPDGNVLITSGDDKNVRILKAQTGEQLHVLAQAERTMSIAWSSDGSLFAMGDVLGAIRLWRMNPANVTDPITCVYTLEGNRQIVYGMTFSPDNSLLVVTSGDGKLSFLEAASGTLIQSVQAHNGWALRVRWSPDGRSIATSGRDQVVMMWDVQQGTFRAALRGHRSMVTALSFTLGGKQLLSGSQDGSIRVWDTASGECIRVMEGYTTSITDMDWSPDGHAIVSGGTDFLVTIHRLDGKTAPRLLHGHRGHLYGVSWSPDGRWIASSERENVVRIWDAQTGEGVQVLTHTDDLDNFTYCIAWSPDSRRLAVGTARYGLVIWDVEILTPHWTQYPFPTSIGGRVFWSPDGTQIAGGGNDRQVYLWDAEGNVIKTLVGHESKVASIGWSPDGKRLVSASTSELTVWDVERGERLSTIVERSGLIITVVWGADENVVISGSSDGRLRWWDIQTGECLWVRDAHQGAVQTVKKSADAAKLASCGIDGAVMIWDIRTGEHLLTTRRDRPYERLDITGIRGLTDAQKVTLQALGAVENP